jgi:hypothetical protein
MVTFSRLLLAILLACVIYVYCEDYDEDNDPSNFEDDYVYNIRKLRKEGKLSKKPWSDSYWPSYEGGIAYRWNDDSHGEKSFKYKLHTKKELLHMNVSQISSLSPAEKLDIYNRDYRYPTVRSEWKRTSKDDPTWEGNSLKSLTKYLGICHGWASASLHYKQPDAVNMTNQDGILIPFGASDVKALLSYFVGVFMPDADVWFVGTRCDYDIEDEDKEHAEDDECRDTNAGGFHVAITNEIGSRDHSVIIADVDRGEEVWNMPVYHYDYVLTENLTSRTYDVNLTLSWATEIDAEWRSAEPVIDGMDLSYSIEVNKRGNITGGSYHAYNRVDFLWTQEILDFSGYFKSLKEIYANSIGGDIKQAYGVEKPMFGKLNDLPLTDIDGKIHVVDYLKRQSNTWVIEPPNATRIGIKVHSLNLSKIYDTIKIYEGKDGPLISVLHGKKIPDEDIIINGESAYVVFAAGNKQVEHGGFELHYYSTTK